MNVFTRSFLAAAGLAALAGCQQSSLPSAPPPVYDSFSDAAEQGPAVLSDADQRKRYQGEAGPSPSEE